MSSMFRWCTRVAWVAHWAWLTGHPSSSAAMLLLPLSCRVVPARHQRTLSHVMPRGHVHCCLVMRYYYPCRRARRAQSPGGRTGGLATPLPLSRPSGWHVTRAPPCSPWRCSHDPNFAGVCCTSPRQTGSHNRRRRADTPPRSTTPYSGAARALCGPRLA